MVSKSAGKVRTRSLKPKVSRIKAKSSVVENGSSLAGVRQKLFSSFEQVNQGVLKLEGELETLVKKVKQRSEHSRRDLQKSFRALVKKLKSSEVLVVAKGTRRDLEKEMKRLVEEATASVKELENLVKTAKVRALFKNFRTGLQNALESFSEHGVVLQAKKSVVGTRKELLGLLSIPSQEEFESLARKISNIEKRLTQIARKAA